MPHRSHVACVIPYIVVVLASLVLFGGYSHANPTWPRNPTDTEIAQAAREFLDREGPAIKEYRIVKYHDKRIQPVADGYNANEVQLFFMKKYDGKTEFGGNRLEYTGSWHFSGGGCWAPSGSPSFSSLEEFITWCLAEDYYGYGWVSGQPPSQNRPPTVRLSYSPANPTPNDTIYFQADASDPDGDSLAYRWFLNDVEQTRATAPNVRWSNPTPGTYTMRVIVSDGRGGTAEDSVEISVGVAVGVAVEFVKLGTGKSAYAPGDVVKVIYELTNPGAAPVDYHVEYAILDPSGKQVYNFIGVNHTISPGENQAWQSTKWAIPATAAQGSYEIQARCISTSGVDEESASFKVVSEEIEVSYTLGYDMLMSESEPVPLRVRFRVKDESGLRGIVGISMVGQMPEVFRRYPARPPSDPLNRVEYDYPGTKDAQYDFYVVRLIDQRGVSFVALLEVINEIGELEEREVPFTVNIEAAFTVYATSTGMGPDGRPTPPLLNGDPLPLHQATKGGFGDRLRLFQGCRVVMRELSGASYAIQYKEGSPDLYWELSVGPWNHQQLRDYQMEDASTARLTLEKIGQDKSVDKALEMLFKKVGKKASGPVGIILDVFEGSPIGDPNARAVLKLRSTVGVTIAASGDVTVRNFEGSPEIIQPDGSVLSLPAGYETKMKADGSFTVPTPYDPSTPSVRIWADEIGQPPPSGAKTIEQALDADNNKIIEDFEMLQALQYWIKQQIVPGTNKTIDDLTMLALLQKWIKATPIP